MDFFSGLLILCIFVLIVLVGVLVGVALTILNLVKKIFRAFFDFFNLL